MRVVAGGHRLLRGAVVAALALAVLGVRLALPHLYPAAGEPAPLVRVEGAVGRVALTFDVTWSDAEVQEVLRFLAAEKLHATFFVSHHWAANYPDLLRRMQAQGEEIGTLGFRMVAPTTLSPGELRTELGLAQGLLARTLGRPARYYRPYEGQWNPQVLEAARHNQLVTVAWSVDGGDFTTTPPPPQEIARRVLARAGPGDVIRLQASGFSGTTAEALPAILRGLRSRGLEPGTVTELLQSVR